MHAVDTNVVVRFVVRDDLEQLARATLLFRSERIWIGLTVILEAEWVLRSSYGYKQHQVTAAFVLLAGLENVSIENPAALARAIAWCDAGMDFADALHLSAAGGGRLFYTFDAPMVKVAKRLGITEVRGL